MTLREILVVERQGHDNASVLAVTGWLANAFNAFVRGLCVYAAPDPTIAECFAIGDRPMRAVSDHLDRQRDESVVPVETGFRATLTEAGASGDWARIDSGAAVDTGPLRARLVDLVVLPRPAGDDHASLRLVESFLSDGGTPCLLVPEAIDLPVSFDRILLAWNGSREAKRALDAALPLLARAAAVQVVVVGDPTESEAQGHIDALAARLARHGITIDARHHPRGHTAQQILESCRTFDADLLVLGAYGQSRTTEAILGGVTRTVLLNAPVPVLMDR
ncbi:universal stress protein [Sphingomonas sp. H39-1-10]|uniref:universal stress protein n=1 Tax=Sphingomonas pollutisoli TaxID=3030829 RepID=UPI0023B9D1BA|nr:universal stress protein [Sphingomonas pollutisoli]MDF0487588.1 universal stress protein [Sphingomonas pollutisoli]